MVRATRGELRGREVEEPLACPRRHHLHEPEQVLARVAEPDPATDPVSKEEAERDRLKVAMHW